MPSHDRLTVNVYPFDRIQHGCSRQQTVNPPFLDDFSCQRKPISHDKLYAKTVLLD